MSSARSTAARIAGPTQAILAAVLLAELIYVLATGGAAETVGETAVTPKEVGLALFGPYVLGVELASMLLLAGLVGAYHLGRHEALSDPQPPEAP